MVDFNKVNGVARPGETLVGDLDFFTITVSGGTVRSDGAAGVSAGVDLNGVPHDAESYLFTKIMEAVSSKTQPVILTGGPTGTTVINMVAEHNTVWTEAGATDPKAESMATVINNVISALADVAGNPLYSGVSVAVTSTPTL